MVLHRLAVLVLRSLFLYGYGWARRGSLLLLLAHAVLATMAVGSSTLAALLLAPLLALLYWLTGMTRLLAYAAVLASIPGAWLALTQLLLDLAAGGVGLQPLVVYVRYVVLSLNYLAVLHYANLDEASWLLHRVTRSCAVAAFPLLAWRSIGQLVREAGEALLAHRLKGVEAWRTLAVLFLRAEEAAEALHESHAGKLAVCSPSPNYSLRAVALQAAMLAYDLLLLSLLK